MPNVLDLLFAPVRLPLRALDDLHRIAAATEGIHERLHPVEHDIDGLREAFEGSNRQLAKMRKTFTPQFAALHAELTSLRAQVGSELHEVRETVEPLQGAAKRVGRVVERLPGPGRTAG
jgi:hypothetical protein